MNDFTKEELVYLLKAWSRGNPIYCNPDLVNDIYIKIQSMIENYCDHEPSDKYPNDFKWQICSKCGRDYK